jgi:hypothetical protein
LLTAPFYAISKRFLISFDRRISIHDDRHLAQRATARFQRLKPGVDRLDGADDSPADMRHYQLLPGSLRRQSHAALEESLRFVIQGSGFGEVAQNVNVDVLGGAFGQDGVNRTFSLD